MSAMGSKGFDGSSHGGAMGQTMGSMGQTTANLKGKLLSLDVSSRSK